MMEAVNSVPVIEDIKGEPGTNAGGMLEKVRQVMSNLTNLSLIHILPIMKLSRW